MVVATASRTERIELADAPRAENFMHARPSRRYVVGVDLGQSADPTAVCVLEHSVGPTTVWTVQDRDRQPPLYRQVAAEYFDVRHLQRLPLGLSYLEQVALVGQTLTRPPLNECADLVIDQTGVGAAVGDIFEHAGLMPSRVTITGGDADSCTGEHRYSVAKSILISNLDARLHRGDLRIAAELIEASALREELRDFRRKVSASGRFSFEARTGKHDDLVLSVAISLWWALRPEPPQLVIHSAWS